MWGVAVRGFELVVSRLGVSGRRFSRFGVTGSGFRCSRFSGFRVRVRGFGDSGFDVRGFAVRAFRVLEIQGSVFVVSRFRVSRFGVSLVGVFEVPCSGLRVRGYRGCVFVVRFGVRV